MAYLDESLASGETIVGRFELHWTAKWRLIVFLLLRRRIIENMALTGIKG